MESTPKDNHAEMRFELTLDGYLAVLEYRYEDEAVALVHTLVPPQLEGRGIGGRLARAALESARERGLRVVPRCPFVAAYIERHKEYAPLVR